ncbi:Hypothetical predicted protein [Mytilus galloprovincialis]|uniref:Uncharacterized protein n=1 Tax=Mytilus galloprovincialis TaxID=29158 RepID=A0A8B6DJD8_MYTGA|nr:Hypothetical predicted protein [Mytilus galloprovincialis]
MSRGDRGGSSRGSGTRCVAANCGNTNADGFSLHSFPKDPIFGKNEQVAEYYQNISTVSEPAEDSQNTAVSEPAEDIDQPNNHVMDFEEVVEYEVDDPKPTTATFSCQVNKKQKRDISKARLIQRPRSIRTLQRK